MAEETNGTSGGEAIYVGIDGGATTSKVAAVRGDESVVTLDLLQRPTGGDGGPPAVVRSWIGAVGEFLAENGLDWKQVRGVGVAVPGPRRSYGVLDSSPNLPESFGGWDVGRDLGEALEREAGRPISLSLGNDGNLGGVAEAAQVRGRGARASMVMLAPGSGLGGAYIDADGLPLDGDTLAGMEVGHMPAPLQLLGVEAFPCGCGRDWGCFEQYTSLAGLPKLLENALVRYPGHELEHSDKAPKEKAMALRGLAQKGDALALELFDFQAKAMGVLVADLAMAVDSKIFIIGGGLMDPGATTEEFRARYLGILRDTALKYVWATQREQLEVVPASLGELSQAIGAALVALYRERGTADMGQ
jgi:glucokinase